MRSLFFTVKYFSNLIFLLFLYCTCWFIFAFSPSQSKRCGQEFPHGAQTEYKRKEVRRNSGKPYVPSYRPLSISWHTLLATVSRQMLFHLISLPWYSTEFTEKSEVGSQNGGRKNLSENKNKGDCLNERLSKLFARAFCTIADYERFLLILRLNRVIDFLFMLLLSGKRRVALITNFHTKLRGLCLFYTAASPFFTTRSLTLAYTISACVFQDPSCVIPQTDSSLLPALFEEHFRPFENQRSVQNHWLL